MSSAEQQFIGMSILTRVQSHDNMFHTLVCINARALLVGISGAYCVPAGGYNSRLLAQCARVHVCYIHLSLGRVHAIAPSQRWGLRLFEARDLLQCCVWCEACTCMCGMFGMVGMVFLGPALCRMAVLHFMVISGLRHVL
jgi:hypothetical protein